MNRLIQNLCVAIITFILGLFALDLWTTLNPAKLVYPKQMVISEEQYKELNKLSDNPRCYELTPRFMIMDANGLTHCEGGERVRIPNCR